MGLQITFSNRTESLAEALSENIAQERKGNPFVCPQVVVPDSALGRWLKIEIAKNRGICAGIEIAYLEESLWNRLIPLLPDSDETSYTMLKSEEIAWMIFNHCLAEKVNPLGDYLGNSRDAVYERKLWQISNRLAGLFLEYQRQRQEMVDLWIKGKLSDEPSEEVRDIQEMEAELYRIIFKEGGMRDRIAENSLTLVELSRRVENWSSDEIHPPLYFFALSQIAPFFVDLMGKLAKVYDLRLYLLNYCEEFWEDVTTPKEDRRFSRLNKLKFDSNTGELPSPSPEYENTLLKMWGKPGRELMKKLSDLEDADTSSFASDWAVFPEGLAGNPELNRPNPGTVLGGVQARILSRRDSGEDLPRLRSDDSLQFIGAPDVYREVEGVASMISEMMGQDKNLKLTDIAVLVPTIQEYRFAIDAVFSRPVRLVKSAGDAYALEAIPYNLSDSNAKDDSTWASAFSLILKMLDSSIDRRELFSILRNPCAQVAARIDSAVAEKLIEDLNEAGAFRWVDSEHRAKDGAGDEIEFTWNWALAKLRLFDLLGEEIEWGGVLAKQGKNTDETAELQLWLERLFVFQRELSNSKHRMLNWVDKLESIARQLLSIPDDMSQEATVRDSFLNSLKAHREKFLRLDENQLDEAIGIDVVRDWATTLLEGISSRKGSFLFGGVTVSSLQPMRPIPFKVIFICGMQEGVFPGEVNLQSLDLRHSKRRLGDISLPERNRYLFLEIFSSAREKLIISRIDRDTNKGKDLIPNSVISELKQYLRKHVYESEPKYGEASLKTFSDREGALRYGQELAPSMRRIYTAYELWRSGSIEDPTLKAILSRAFLRKYDSESDGRDEKDDPCLVDPNYDRRRRLFKVIKKWECRSRKEADKLVEDLSAEITKRESVSVKAIERFLKSPAEGVLTYTLGVWEDREETQLDEPDKLDGLSRWKIYQELITMLFSTNLTVDEMFSHCWNTAVKRGMLPQKSLRKAIRETLLSEFKEWLNNAEKMIPDWLQNKSDVFEAVVGDAPSSRPDNCKRFPPAIIPIVDSKPKRSYGDFLNFGKLMLFGSHPWFRLQDTTLKVLLPCSSPKEPSRKYNLPPKEIFSPLLTTHALFLSGLEFSRFEIDLFDGNKRYTFANKSELNKDDSLKYFSFLCYEMFIEKRIELPNWQDAVEEYERLVFDAPIDSNDNIHRSPDTFFLTKLFDKEWMNKANANNENSVKGLINVQLPPKENNVNVCYPRFHCRYLKVLDLELVKGDE